MNHAAQKQQTSFEVEWSAALACFILAGITGTAFRLVAAGFSPLSGLTLSHVRHAHSHLMLFSWATPPLMVLIAERFLRQKVQNFRLAQFRRIIRASILVGALTFVPFLISGYTNTRIGPISLPLTIIFSTLGMFVWYAFAWEYARARRNVVADVTWRLWDWATVFLVVCTLGAWARGMFMGMKITDPRLANGSIHFFVILFSFGWLALGMLGVFHQRLKLHSTPTLTAATTLLAAGIPLVFLNAPMGEIPAWLRALGNLSSLLVGAGLSLHLWAFWRTGNTRADQKRIATPALILLAMVALAMLTATVPDVLRWSEGQGLRLVFVHLLLLGVVTLGLLEERFAPGHALGRRAMPIAVLILLATMLPTTGLWPRAFYQPWAFYLVALGSCAPWATALLLLRARQ